MKQKAISLQYMNDGTIRQPSLDELNTQLDLGWLVVSTTAAHVTGNSKTGDVLVILQK